MEKNVTDFGDWRDIEWVSHRASDNLIDLVEGRGFEFPCHTLVVDGRGSVSWTRFVRDPDQIDRESKTILHPVTPQPLEDTCRAQNGRYVLPLRMTIADARGEVAHCVTDANGTRWRRGEGPPSTSGLPGGLPG